MLSSCTVLVRRNSITYLNIAPSRSINVVPFFKDKHTHTRSREKREENVREESMWVFVFSCVCANVCTVQCLCWKSPSKDFSKPGLRQGQQQGERHIVKAASHIN